MTASRTRLKNLAPSALAQVEMFLKAIADKDDGVRAHSLQLLEFCVRIADRLCLPAREREALYIAALLHDVGKVSIPSEVLLAPRELTEDEWAVMRNHAPLGAAMVEAILGQPTITEAVRHHHENWDGTGYPSGLAGEEIPLLARIIAVADSLSAMLQDRPYRRALSLEEGLFHLRRGSGTQWDSECVEALCASCVADPPEAFDYATFESDDWPCPLPKAA